MNSAYKEFLVDSAPEWEPFIDRFHFQHVRANELLLRQGEVARYLFVVIKGCLRSYFVREDGTEVTFQFFLETQGVSSLESAYTGEPTRQYIEAIEDSVVASMEMKELFQIVENDEKIAAFLNNYVFNRLIQYMNLHASFIIDSPEKRYRNLLRENPELIERIPQGYIATYLGITPVSLSRIKNRIKK